MAEFLITAPNGKKYKVTGATREGALAALKAKLGQPQPPVQPTPVSQPVNPEGTGVGRAIQRGVITTGQAFDLKTAADVSGQIRDRDVGPVETLNRVLDRHLSQYPETLNNIRADEIKMLARVPMDRWLNYLGSQYGIDPKILERIGMDVERLELGKADWRQEGGYFDQLRDKGNQALQDASEKQQRIEGLPMSPTAQRGAQDFQDADGVMDWAKKSFRDPIGAMAFIGEVAAQTTPGIAAGIGTSVLTGNPVAGAGVMILANAPQSFSGKFVEFLREQDIDISDPTAIKDALSNDDILAEARRQGYTKAAIVGFFEALGMKGGGGILAQTARQGVTGGAGEGTSEYVLTGEIDWKDVALETVAEIATVPGEAAIMTTRKIVNKDGDLADFNSLSDNEKQAGSDVARLLREIAETNGYNLRDTNVSSEKGGKKALEAARKRIIDRLRVLKSDPAIKQYLTPKQRKSLAQLIDDFAPADGAFRAANNKVSDRVTQDQFDAVMRLLPPSKEAAEIANLLMMSNQVTDLFNAGLKGGISQYTDYFNPFIRDGSYDPSRAANIIIGTGAGLTLGPLATAGIVGGGRTFDFVTGRRAAALDRFVRKNEKSAGLPEPGGPSIIDMAQSASDAQAARKEQEAALKEQRKQESKDLNLTLARKNEPPTPNSPQDTLEVATGLNRNNVAKILRILKARNDSPPALLRAIEQYEQSIATGGKPKDLSPLIRAVKGFQRNNPEYVPLDFQPDDAARAPIVDQTPAQDTPTPDVMSQAPQFGPQFTTQENYNRGIEANQTAAQTLSLQAQNDPNLSVQDKAVIASALDKLQGNLGSNPVMNAEAIVEAAVNSGVSQEAIEAYIQPYVDRVARQQANRTPPSMPEFDQAINPDIPAPTTVQTAALSAPTPVVHQQIKAPEGQTNHGLLPHLRVEAPTAREGKPLVLAGTNNKNASRQIDGIDEVLARHEDPAGSSEAWASMLGDAMATKDVPVQPHGFIEDLNNGGAQELLSTLTPGQIADADHGFRNAAEFRQAYTNGEIGIEDTGRLFLWSFLSRGVSPYTQEGLFMDSFNGIEEWIRMAAGKSNRGSLADNIKDYEKWAKSAAPKGSGQPGAGATHNLNAFGNTFLMKMSQDAGKGDGRSRLQVIHDMMSDPDTTGKEVRREFLRMGEGVGIDNKVVSFTLLVAGYDDVMVLDRVQMRQMWNDGRFSGINLYDGYKSDGKPVTGSALSSLTYGARGLLVYEAMEKSLQNRLSQIYSDVGRPDAASVGRYHWETWVASSQQEASHGTIDAILKRAKGDPNPLEGVTAKEGEYGAYAYGARYGVENGVPMFTYEVPGYGEFKFTVPDFQKFLEDIKKPKNKVVPTKFKVTESGNAPWYTREGVNLDALAEKAKEHGKQIRTADAELRQSPAVPDGRTPDAPSGEPALFPALSRGTESPAGSGDTTGSQPRGPLSLTTLGRIKQAIARHRPAYQVGKKGGEFENGIQDVQAALELAKAMGQTVRLFDSMEALNKEINRQGLPGAGNTAAIFYRGTKLDPFNKFYVSPKAKGFEGLVFALNPGAKKFDGSKVSDTEALMYLLHEISHGLTLGDMDGGLQSKGESFANPVSRTNDSVSPGSFAGSALLPLVMKSTQKQRDAILEEIANIQVNLDAFTTNKPEERVAVRNVRKLIQFHDKAKAEGASESELFTYKQTLSDYAEYMENIRETAVDPVWVYLMNPNLAKKVMPKTSALIRTEFNKAKDPKIQFFSHPLAVVAAVVAAMMSQREEDDERERQQQQQMPPGALNAPMAPGMLSQA
jgi:hypothetical protein